MTRQKTKGEKREEGQLVEEEGEGEMKRDRQRQMVFMQWCQESNEKRKIDKDLLQ